MAKVTSYDDWYKQYLNETNEQYGQQVGALNTKNKADKDAINATADKSISDIESSYNASIDEAKDSAETAHQKNEIQKFTNQRYLERKAAEMGLTDSGLNRTQLTANQISYANRGGEIDSQLQKQVDTLAATMNSKKADVEISRKSQLAQADATLEANKATLESNRESAAHDYAEKQYNYGIEAAEKQEKAEQNQFETGYNDLLGAIDGMNDIDEAAKLIYDFDENYNLSNAQLQRALNKAGITMSEYDTYLEGLIGYAEKPSGDVPNYSDVIKQYYRDNTTIEYKNIDGGGAGDAFSIYVNGQEYNLKIKKKIKSGQDLYTTLDEIEKKSPYKNLCIHGEKVYFKAKYNKSKSDTDLFWYELGDVGAEWIGCLGYDELKNFLT